MAEPELLVFNGINGATGEYLTPSMSSETVAAIALGGDTEPQQAKDLAFWAERASERSFGTAAGIDPSNLAETGWGVIFPYGSPTEIRAALEPLLDLRREQATRSDTTFYQEFSGPRGYRPGESNRKFLSRCNVEASQPADPARGVPYYLLIVADPEQIPFEFQYQLDVQYAVGRIWFDSLQQYAQYARSVVASETRQVRVNRNAVFFGVQNSDDPATNLSATELVRPLADKLPAKLSQFVGKPWNVTSVIGEEADKAKLSALLGGSETPALLFTASHGMGFPNGDGRQLSHQGALLCQDWPGPRAWNRPIPEEFYFSASDVSGDANLQGMIAFHFACYGAGTPKLDDYVQLTTRLRAQIAPHAFVASLPQRMLGLPGGALAVVGHVERAWGYSFSWAHQTSQLQTFESSMYQIMSGRTIGEAIEYFNTRYAALSTELTSVLDDIRRFGDTPDDRALAGTWTANNDARSYVILGDPAVRLPLVDDNESETRPLADPIVLSAPEGDVNSTTLIDHSQTGTDDVRDGSLLDQIASTERRFREQASNQQSFNVPSSAGNLQRRNEPGRLRWRLEELGVAPELVDNISRLGVSFQSVETAGETGPEPTDDRLLERVLGRNDMVDAPRFLERGAQAVRSVGRIRIRSRSGALRGWGTGSLVAPRLLLTNHHVLTSAESAAASLIEFNVQDQLNGRPMTPVVFRLQPNDLFITDQTLDFTLVAVEDVSESGESLEGFGHNPGTIGDDPILVTETVNIVQHPQGRPKQAALRDNQVTDILDDFIHYQADTEPGSSGSPVFNDQWQLVALHHSGVPRRDTAGKLLARDGSIWREEMGDNQIDWVANEGVRLSRIIEFVRIGSLPSSADALRQTLFQTQPNEGAPTVSDSQTPESKPLLTSTSAQTSNGTLTITVPLTVSIKLGSGTENANATLPSQRVATNPSATAPVQESVSIDPDYDTREGYDPEFLGTGTRRIPFPKLSESQRADAAVLLNPPPGADRFELKYHHFSLVMSASRRIARVTAVNIDGNKFQDIRRESDRWLFDPRISRDEQVGNELYRANVFDRGHLVRRLDPAWGRTQKIAKVANDDTFHWSNCSPQHERFNQRQNLWQGIETFLLDRATDAEQKLTVFTGPVFRDEDPVYRSIKIPLEYWKVAILVGECGAISALAFLVTQKELIEPVVDEAAIDTARTFQTTVAEIEQLTGLNFGSLRTLNVGTVDSFAVTSGQPSIRLPLTSYDDIQFAGTTSQDTVDFSRPNTAAASVAAANPKERVTGTDLSYYLLAYDAKNREREDHPAGLISEAILSALASEPITDVFLFSHGWRGDVKGARSQYQAWLSAMAGCDTDRQKVRHLRPGFRPLLIGLHWPSEPWGDESLSNAVSFAAGAANEVVESMVDDYAARLGDSPEIRNCLQTILEAAQTGDEPDQLPDELIDAYENLDAAVALPKNGVGGAPGSDWDGFDPSAVYDVSRRDAAASGSVSFGLFSRDTLLAPLRVMSFWKMKDRARSFGEGCVNPLLRKLQSLAAGRNVRIHLAGHSFGCIAASAAIAGTRNDAPLDRPVDSLVMLQGALSLWSYCNNIPDAPGTPGYFQRIISRGSVRGPIVTSQSRFDSAVGTWYPRAAWSAGQVAFAAPGQFPKYGAVGAFGVQGPGVRVTNTRMLPLNGEYGFRAGMTYNIESSDYINTGGGLSGAHSDICKPEVAHLVWSAISTIGAR